MMERERDLSQYEAKAQHATYGNISTPANRLTPPTGVMAQAELLMKHVAVAHDLVERLANRLLPVTESRPEPPRDRDARGGVPEEYSPLGTQLAQANRQLLDLHLRLEAMTETLRL